jgi:hypothetical protein
MNISIQKRASFSREEDLFLKWILTSVDQFHDKLLWSQVAKLYNEKFPFSKKTRQQLKIHHQNCIQRDLKNDDFSKDEMVLFSALKYQNHFTFFRIAEKMCRTVSSVKNYYYREYYQLDQINISFENGEDQSKNENQEFSDDLEIFGISSE